MALRSEAEKEQWRSANPAGCVGISSRPTRNCIVSDGQTVFSYDPGLNQVVETPLKDALQAPGAAEFLLGVGNIRKDFIASAPKSPPADGLTHVTLTPQQGGDTIELGIAPTSGDITAA